MAKKATLIITEKPQAAAKIATALSNATDEKITTKDNVSFYEFLRDGKRYIVGCAVGHLFGIQQKASRGPFPNFDVDWAPAYRKKASAFTKKYLDVLKNLVKESDDFIVATDFDVEGEVIGWNVVRFVAGKKEAKRMKFSSLTKEELEKSFKNLLPTLNWGAAIAGETRHFLDWFYGINLSRGLMKAISSTGNFRILSIGRVQGPALKILVEREREISSFKPEPFWQVFLNVEDGNKNRAEVKYVKDIFKKSELLRFNHLKGKEGIASTKIVTEKISPPTPFDLTSLQTESYRNFGYTPHQTMRIAQELYLAGLISYPRTSSQKYPQSIGYEKILNKLKKYTTLVKYAKNKKPTEGKKTDPAHPAIYPTGEIKKLDGPEKKLYDLIVKRFIACFCKEATIEKRHLEVDVSGLKFSANGSRIIEKEWMNVYPHKIKEEEIPIIRGPVDIREIRIEEKETKPPKRFTAASLVKELEKRGLGTKATRAQIVETLYSRGYIREKSIEVTELGMKLVEALEKYAPIILDEDLTREMSLDLEKIEVSNRGLESKKKKILSKAKKSIKDIASRMLKHLKEIGKSLSDANLKIETEERKANTMSKCPSCKKGNLRILFGKKYSRYFVSCDAYPDCKTVFSLPPNGVMKPARDKSGNLEKCVECGFPLVTSLRKGRAPWKFCFNPKCPSNKEMQKKKEEFKAKLKSGEIEIDKNGKIIEKSKKGKTKKANETSEK
ncbi:DNA topoisomerase I [Candidatus Pacearchaeota archaeon]|nr:MAG: DNA topoisomerase I [Candidatus Pacearchaeota archaeon]